MDKKTDTLLKVIGMGLKAILLSDVLEDTEPHPIDGSRHITIPGEDSTLFSCRSFGSAEDAGPIFLQIGIMQYGKPVYGMHILLWPPDRYSDQVKEFLVTGVLTLCDNGLLAQDYDSAAAGAHPMPTTKYCYCEARVVQEADEPLSAMKASVEVAMDPDGERDATLPHCIVQITGYTMTCDD